MDDLICRQRILNELDRIISIGIKGKDGRTPISAEIFRDFVEAVPIIQPEQKIGRWLINPDGYYLYCSACKGEPKNGIMTDFCPKCGRRMKGDV